MIDLSLVKILGSWSKNVVHEGMVVSLLGLDLNDFGGLWGSKCQRDSWRGLCGLECNESDIW